MNLDDRRNPECGAVDQVEKSTTTRVRQIIGSQILRERFDTRSPSRAAGAHNAMGAKIAERCGFDAVWSSGLEISTSRAEPDQDILSMNELHAIASSMVPHVSIPVIADCDAGYGNELNVSHLVRTYERSGIAAVSIEDKTFPKSNSFLDVEQRLLDIDKFCLKIEYAKAAQSSSEFMVIARTEALIAGLDVDAALKRSNAYVDAGADAVIIHSKKSSPVEIFEFLDNWNRDTPVVVIPTTYHNVSATELFERGASLVIYANHGLRASIRAISATFKTILEDDSSAGSEASIASLAEVFEISQNATSFSPDSSHPSRLTQAPGRKP